jgi:rhodanese-related sulfurtransferase
MATGVKDLVAAAEAQIETISPASALALHGEADVTFVDLRDIREIWREGKIPGAQHVPRGMLEFWLDSESPYYRADIFDRGGRFVFYCNLGWRSALATQVAQVMGLENACHIEGGFTHWVAQGGPVEPVAQK